MEQLMNGELQKLLSVMGDDNLIYVYHPAFKEQETRERIPEVPGKVQAP